MVATTQIEAKLAFEPPKTPEYGTSGDSGSVARESTKPDFIRGSENSAAPGPVSGGDEAFSIDLSAQAQQVAANDPGSAAQSGTQSSAPDASALSSTVETSATAEIGSNTGASSAPANDTNQIASIENERSGNDTSNTTEAGRTLGQVIDTFA